MKHEMKARYDAPASVVIKMFVDKDFHTRKLEAMGLRKYQVLDHQFDGSSFRIKIERHVPVEAPGMVKKVVPLEARVVNEETWDVASRTGRVNVEPQGMPVEMSCLTSIADDGAGSVVTYSWEIRAKVPVMGGSLEKFIASDMENRSAEETRIANSLLGQYR